MQWYKKVGGAVLAMTAILGGWTSSGQAQIFDTPVLDFVLEALPTPSAAPFPSLPLTLNVGNYDTSINGPGDLPLNEVAIAGISGFVETDPIALVHRYWTIVHDSATDTRSLVQTAPSDIAVTDEFEPFYLIPDSLQLVDLDGNGADIVTDAQLPEGITCDATLWAACIGGAMQVDAYAAAIESAGLRIDRQRVNPEYRFLSSNATNASRKYGVKSISVVALKG